MHFSFCRLLYDACISHALEWPSLTIEWLPGTTPYARPPGPSHLPIGDPPPCRSSDKGYEEHRVIIGTHTSESEQNYLLTAKVPSPLPPILPAPPPPPVSILREPGLKQWYRVQIVIPAEGADCRGGGSQPARVEMVQRIPHDGEVNRARHMPQMPNIIATKAPAAEVMIFDSTKHPNKPDLAAQCAPDMKLTGHEKEGYGLAWSLHTAGKLLSGSDDTHICLWDIEANHSNKMVLATTPPCPLSCMCACQPGL